MRWFPMWRPSLNAAVQRKEEALELAHEIQVCRKKLEWLLEMFRNPDNHRKALANFFKLLVEWENEKMAGGLARKFAKLNGNVRCVEMRIDTLRNEISRVLVSSQNYGYFTDTHSQAIFITSSGILLRALRELEEWAMEIFRTEEAKAA